MAHTNCPCRHCWGTIRHGAAEVALIKVKCQDVDDAAITCVHVVLIIFILESDARRRVGQWP
jgi:hypothetical protein